MWPTVEKRVDLLVVQALVRLDEALVDVDRRDVALGIDAQLDGQRRATHTRQKTQLILAERARQHGNDFARKIDARAPRAGLHVERGTAAGPSSRRPRYAPEAAGHRRAPAQRPTARRPRSLELSSSIVSVGSDVRSRSGVGLTVRMPIADVRLRTARGVDDRVELVLRGRRQVDANIVSYEDTLQRGESDVRHLAQRDDVIVRAPRNDVNAILETTRPVTSSASRYY